MLDKLVGEYIEVQCINPSFIGTRLHRTWVSDWSMIVSSLFAHHGSF